MQRNIVEHRHYSLSAQIFYERCSALQVRQEDVIHVRVLPAMSGHCRPPQQSALLKPGKGLMITIPERDSARSDLAGIFQLSPKKRSGDLARQVRRPNVAPCVLVHLAAKELASIRAFFTDDF